MTIKELLKRISGLEVDVVGGLGGSTHDPIVHFASSPADACLLEYRVISAIAKARGALWRGLSTSRLDDSGAIQRKIERIQVSDAEVVTETVNYYFKRSGQIRCDQGVEQQPIAYFDTAVGLAVPCHLSWLHFGGATECGEESSRRVGCSLAYGAPGIQATIYIYPMSKHHVGNNALQVEMRAAIEDFKALHGDGSIKHDWGVQLDNGKVRFAFIPASDQGATSIIQVMERAKHIVKLRCTFTDESFMRRVCADFLRSFEDLVQSGSG